MVHLTKVITPDVRGGEKRKGGGARTMTKEKRWVQEAINVNVFRDSWIVYIKGVVTLLRSGGKRQMRLLGGTTARG